MAILKKISPVLLAVLLFAGCRENYLAEKEFWKAERILSKVSEADFQPGGVQKVESAIAAFRKVTEKYPSAPKAAESFLKISRLYARLKNYEAARKNLEKIIENFSGQGNLAPDARFETGQLYEREGNRRKAEETYWELAEYHPLQPRGLYAPVHILLHYQKLGDKVSGQKAYERTIDFYKKNSKRVGPIQAGAGLEYYTGLAHWIHGDGPKAEAIWLSLPQLFPQSDYSRLALLGAADLALKRKDFKKALRIQEQFLQKYPRHPLLPRIYVQMGLACQELKDFEKARAWFSKVAEIPRLDAESSAEIRLLIAKSFEAQGSWAEADKLYREIEARYPQTQAGLQVPLLRYSHFEEIGNSQQAEETIHKAIALYGDLKQKEPNAGVAAYAGYLQNQAFAKIKNWQAILENLDENFQKERSAARKAGWLFLKAVLVERRLQDSTQAQRLYQDLMTQFPRHPLSQLAKTRYDALMQPH